MAYVSPYLLVKSLETQLNGVLSSLDIYSLPAAEQKLIQRLKADLVDSRLDVRDYELSETRVEQLGKAVDARKRLDRIRGNILAASEYNIFSAIDVAQLTAQIEQVMDKIE